MNTFLEVHKHRINQVRHRIDEFKLRNNAHAADLPLNDMIFLYNGFVSEITKLQNEFDRVNKELNLYKNVTK